MINNHLNYLIDNTFKIFLRSIIDCQFFKQFIFFTKYNDKKSDKDLKKKRQKKSFQTNKRTK